ncbi:MAG: 50S ribosomal protein L29 [Helicobacteraceae bacterium]|jgi:large subunit ribosomal protein L29|nr:50S ribosomal protein L29 [Helicobacteraceae bacterium]MDR2034167.1 50S ribosomal protein L29 [Helicobacteraceae bacterium]
MSYTEKKTALSKRQKINVDLRAKSKEDLIKELKEKKTQLFSLRLKLKTMQLSSPSEIGSKRIEIARIQTALSAKARESV